MPTSTQPVLTQLAISPWTVFEAIKGMRFVFQPDAPKFTIAAASDDMCRHVHTVREHLVGKSIFEAFPANPADPDFTGHENLRASLEYVLQHKAAHQMEHQRYDVPMEDGSFKESYWNNYSTPVLNEHGEVLYIIHTTEDITDTLLAAKRESQIRLDAYELAKKELAEKEQSLALALEIGELGVFTVDLKTGTGQYSQQVMDWFGFDFPSMPMTSILATIHSDDQALVENTLERSIAGEWDGRHDFLYRVVQPKTDAIRYLRSIGQVKYENDVAASISGIIQDVTKEVIESRKLEESEARFRSLVEKAPVATCLFMGPEMVIEVANEAMIQVWGKGPGVMGMPLAVALPELKGQHFLPLLEELFTTGNAFSEKGGRADLVVDGRLQTFYFDYDFKPLRNAEGIVYAILETAVDVTEQVKAKQALEKSEENLRNMILQAPVAMCIFRGANYVVEIANERMFEFWGKPGADILHKPIFEGLPEAKGQGFEELLLSVYMTGATVRLFEVPITLPRNGKLETVYINFVYEAFKEADGVISGIMAVALDVTEQVLARRKIEESEQYARSLFYNSPVAVLVYVGEDMVLREANAKMLDIFGRGHEIIGKPILDAIPELGDTPLRGRYLNVLKTGITHTEYAEKILLVKAGQPYWGYYDYTYKALHDTTGAVYGVICTAIEVTEQVMARQKLQEKEIALEAVLEQLQLSKEAAELGTFDMNMENNDMHWDDRCRLLFGITHQQPVSYEKDFIERLHPDDQQRVLRVLNQTFDKVLSNGNYDVEYRTIGAEDGVERWVRAKGKVYFNAVEKPLRFVGSVLDITEQRNALEKIENTVVERTKELAAANETLLSLNKELKRSNANLEEFVHAASHDLKEPVRKIHFFTSQLKNQLSDRLKEGEAGSFSRIEKATERMGALIDDLLLYSHVSHRPHETEVVDLNTKVQKALEDLELDIEEKRATVHVGRLPLVQGYKRQLQQLFQNLIGNALKYSKTDEPPRIDVSASKAEEANRQYHVISVRDNGIGFEQEYEDKIFQMFARLHGKAEYSGTGVGLSIVKKVVENHNGLIRVKSAVGEGSVFEIYLPV